MDIDCTVCDFVRSCQAALKLSKFECIEVATRFYAKQPQHVFLQKQLTQRPAEQPQAAPSPEQVTAVQHITALAGKLEHEQPRGGGEPFFGPQQPLTSQ